MELDFISPVKNTLKSTSSAVSNICNSASNGLGKMAKNSPNGSVFYGGFNAPFFYGFGCGPWAPCGPWGWGGFIPYNNPLVFTPWHSPFLGVYTDPVSSVLSFGGTSQPAVSQVTNAAPTTMPVASASYDPMASLFGNFSVVSALPENPFAVPIFGATPEALALMGYNVPQYQQTQVAQPAQQQQTFTSQVTAPVPASSPVAPAVITPVSGAATPDLYFHPERYAAQGITPVNNTEPTAPVTQEAKQQVTSDNAMELQEELPSYYTELANKKRKGQKLTSQEEDLYNKYQKIINEYSPFEKDKDGRILKDTNNNPIRTKLYSKIEELHGCMDSHDNVAAERIIRNCSPEELAAIEFYWMSVVGATDANGNATYLNDKPFRTMLKDSYMWCWTSGWLNFNNSDCEKLFDYIDSKVSELSPRSIALSFYQYTNNCHQWGTGIDRDRVIALLNKIKGNQPLIDAVIQEYRSCVNKLGEGDDSLYSAITGHTFVFQNSETYKLASEVLHGSMHK